jgi:hypothetical protein
VVAVAVSLDVALACNRGVAPSAVVCGSEAKLRETYLESLYARGEAG